MGRIGRADSQEFAPAILFVGLLAPFGFTLAMGGKGLPLSNPVKAIRGDCPFDPCFCVCCSFYVGLKGGYSPPFSPLFCVVCGF